MLTMPLTMSRTCHSEALVYMLRARPVYFGGRLIMIIATLGVRFKDVATRQYAD